MASTDRGAFLLIEGIDKIGKSTQVAKLHEFLNKELKGKVEVFKFPNRTTKIGKLIDECLADKKEIRMNPQALHHLFVANRYEAVDSMITKMKAGITLVVDRFSFSGVAYGLTDTSTNVDDGLLESEFALPAPDRIYLLEPYEGRSDFDEVDWKTLVGGDTKPSELYEKAEFLAKVQKQFGKLAGSDPHGQYWKRVGVLHQVHRTRISADAIHAKIAKDALQAVAHAGKTSIATLKREDFFR